VSSAPRAARPAASRRLPVLAEGPLLVPISTIDWLVSRESPAARHVTLRDLLVRPPKDPELRKARQAVTRDPYVRDALPLLRKALAPQCSGEDLSRKYDGGYWKTLFLLEIGCDGTLPEVRHAADVFFSRWQRTFVDVERLAEPVSGEGLFSTICRALALMGYAEDARILAACEFLARKRIASDQDPRKADAITKDLLLFAAIPKERRSALVQSAIDFSAERILSLPVKPAEGFGFPTGEESDLLERLYALALSGIPLRPRILELLGRVAARADHRARFTLDRSALEGRLTIERVGELSRWVTIRALRTMQHFVGLTIVEKR
jgi:hypothetical protein